MALIDDTKKLLEALGYELKIDDDVLLDFCIKFAQNRIKAECNITNIPEELNETASRIAAGEFLSTRKSMGMLDGLNVDLSGAVSQLKLGDTSVSFGSSSSPEQRLDITISSLRDSNYPELLRYRRMAW